MNGVNTRSAGQEGVKKGERGKGLCGGVGVEGARIERLRERGGGGGSPKEREGE